MHANLDGSKKGEQEYNPILRKTLQEKGFDYVALGHIHKSNYAEAKEDGHSYNLILVNIQEQVQKHHVKTLNRLLQQKQFKNI